MADPSSPTREPTGEHGESVERRRLAALTTVDAEESPHRILLVPLGATEQHGPHLTLDTDTVIAIAWAEAAALRIPALVAPALPYGSSGEHQSFAGTLSIGAAVLELVLVELARSARDRFDRIVFVAGHAGNADALQRVVSLLRAEGHDARWVIPRLDGADPHAGHTETALMLHLAPERVRSDRAEPGNTEKLTDLIDVMRRGGVAAVSPNGVLGDPTSASADHGRVLFDQLVELLVTAATESTD